MVQGEAPADIVLDLARAARMPQDRIDIYLDRMNKAVWRQITAYREIVDETGGTTLDQE